MKERRGLPTGHMQAGCNANHLLASPDFLAHAHTHTPSITAQGEVYTWGLNEKGQLGTAAGPTSGDRQVPRRMELLFGWDVRAIACGAEHTVALTPQDVITWGSNGHGECGHGEKAETVWVKPRSLKMLHEQMVTQVVCGAHHTLCVTATSQVYAWGQNDHGQLGLGDFHARRTPATVDGLWALPVLQLAAGDSHSAALTSNGFLFSWGANDRGQLGLPTAADVAQQIQASRTASERKRVNRRVNQRFLTAMVEMGIPGDQAELALHETGNVGVEVATEWLFRLVGTVCMVGRMCLRWRGKCCVCMNCDAHLPTRPPTHSPPPVMPCPALPCLAAAFLLRSWRST